MSRWPLWGILLYFTVEVVVACQGGMGSNSKAGDRIRKTLGVTQLHDMNSNHTVIFVVKASHKLRDRAGSVNVFVAVVQILSSE